MFPFLALRSDRLTKDGRSWFLKDAVSSARDFEGEYLPLLPRTFLSKNFPKFQWRC